MRPISHPILRLSALLLALAGFAHSARAADLNTSTLAELEAVQGIGPGLSQRILQAREARAFSDWDDLLQRVPGLGAVAAVRLSSQGWTLAGAAYAATDSQAFASQPKKRHTSSRLDQASASPRLIKARVNGASNSR